jgi:L-fuconolactonase
VSGLDAHVHLWNRATDPQPWIDPDEMAVIDRDFGLSQLDEMLDSCEVGSAIVVQAANSSGETERLLELAASPGASRIAGVVGWLDLTADVDVQLERLGPAGRTRLVGIRHLVHVDEDPRWLGRPDVGRALDRLAAHGLGFDLVLRPAQLELAAEVVAAHPATRFALDHLGGIVESDDDLAWERGLRILAERDNVVVKLSGLARIAEQADRQRRALDVGLSAFGAARCMYGSDWPLAQLGFGGALAWRSTFLEFIGELTSAEQQQVSTDVATTFYRGAPR